MSTQDIPDLVYYIVFLTEKETYDSVTLARIFESSLNHSLNFPALVLIAAVCYEFLLLVKFCTTFVQIEHFKVDVNAALVILGSLLEDFFFVRVSISFESECVIYYELSKLAQFFVFITNAFRVCNNNKDNFVQKSCRISFFCCDESSHTI